MASSKGSKGESQRALRLSPNHAFSVDYDGRPIVERRVAPTALYRMSQAFGELLARFQVPRTVEGALRDVGRLRPLDRAERRTLREAVRMAVAEGILIEEGADPSMYTPSMLRAYVATRTLPSAVVREVVRRGEIGARTRVLDVGAGAGLLSLPLARVSGSVTAMDISGVFLAEARRRARAEGLALRTIQESGHRLVHHGETYDVVTMCQSIHWLDEAAAIRGALHVLRPGGHLLVVDSVIDLVKRHPLLEMLTGVQRDNLRGVLPSGAVQAERLASLAAALDAPRSSLLRLGGVSEHRERGVFDLDFARGYFTAGHAEELQVPLDELLRRIEARLAGAPRAVLGARTRWTVSHFRCCRAVV